MAEGGGFGFDVPEPAPDDQINEGDLINFGDDDKGDTTRPFWPTVASTPYHGGEKHEMQTFRQEQSGLPDTSYEEETPLLSEDPSTADLERRLANLRRNSLTGLIDTRGIDARVNPLSQEDKEKEIERVKRLIRARYPVADLDGLVIGYSTKKPMDIVVKGPKGGETKIVLDDGSDLQRSFLYKAFVKKQLGEPAGDIIQRTSSEIRKNQKKLQDIQNTERLKRSKEEEVQTLNERRNTEQAKIEQLKEDPGRDNKVEIKDKEQLVKSLEKDLKIKKKELGEIQKRMRAQEKIGQLQSSILERKKKEMPWKKISIAQKLLML